SATYKHSLLEKAEYWLGATDLEKERTSISIKLWTHPKPSLISEYALALLSMSEDSASSVAMKALAIIQGDIQSASLSLVDKPASYFHWLPKEPNNYLGYQNCLAARWLCSETNCSIYGWFDDDCYKKKFFICEKPGYIIT
ncbi:hypothetical protein LSAT2_032753, partial [Lamellibrachia satsuma]